MRARLLATALTSLLISPSLFAQEKASADQRQTLEQILVQSYQPSEIGKKLMGVGAESDVRRPGIIVVVQHEGLYGSLIRNEIASSAIHGLDAELYRGHQDYAVPVGERFYVTAIHVGPSAINFGLLSARAVTTKNGTGRIWTAPTFYFPEDVLANADKDTVLRGIDPWFAPEGRTFSAAPGMITVPTTPMQPQSNPQQPPSPSPSQPTIAPLSQQPARTTTAHLAPGMTTDQVLSALGSPRIAWAATGSALWQYAGLLLQFENDKLVSVEPQANSSLSAVTLQSEPPGAEIYLDGSLAAATPASLHIPPGTHTLTIKLPGYQDWSRELHLLPGTETTFSPHLAKP